MFPSFGHISSVTRAAAAHHGLMTGAIRVTLGNSSGWYRNLSHLASVTLVVQGFILSRIVTLIKTNIGQVVSMEHTRKKLKSSSSATYDVARNSDLTNQISQYLSPEDLVSIHSTSKSQSEAASKNMNYVEARCAVETVDGLACYPAPASCVDWCKQKNISLKRFNAVFKMISQPDTSFKFDNQPAEHVNRAAGIYAPHVISLRLATTEFILRRYNEKHNYSETDESYSYDTYTKKGLSTFYHPHVHLPEVIKRKFELLVSQPFSEWGEWKLIILACFYIQSGAFMPQNEVMSGTINFKGRYVPCKGEIIRINGRGIHSVRIFIAAK